MSAPFKIASNVKWLADVDGNIVGYQNERGLFVAIPSYISDPVTGVPIGFSGPGALPISFVGPSYTFSGLPDATLNAGNTVRVTDIGKPNAGSLWISDGSRWSPLNGSAQISRTNIPFVLPSNGSFANNGALTLGTALDRIYYNGAFMYFPAGAIHSTSLAGWYFTVMSSTTVGTVYTNTYVSGYPSVPAAPGGFVVTGPGAYTQTINTDITSLNVIVPANSLGRQGGIRERMACVYNNTAGAKTYKSFYHIYAFHVSLGTTGTFMSNLGEIANDGEVGRQKQLNQDFSTGLTAGTIYAANVGQLPSTTDLVLSQTLKIVVATDFVALLSYNADIYG